MENCWERLGIDPTADTAAIKKAYAKQLKFNKPDNNPAGFRKLRAAYEQALDESRWYEDEEFVETNSDEMDDVIDGILDNGILNTDCEKNNSKENNSKDNGRVKAIDSAEPNIVFDTIHGEDLACEQADITKAELSKANLYQDVESHAIALTNAIKDNNVEVLPSFEEALLTLEKLSSDEAISNTDIIPSYWSLSHWRDEWQQIADDINNGYDNDNVSDVTLQDQRLHALLQTQLDTSLSLDEQKHFEDELLIWLAEQPTLYTLSYGLSKAYFSWDKRLKDWSHDDYPWNRLESLDKRYQQARYFGSPTAFHEFLTQHFPAVASYLSIQSLSQNKNKHINPSSLSRIDVFIPLFFPFRVTELAQQLNALDAELDDYIYDYSDYPLGLMDRDISADNDAFNARYWQQNSSFTTLKDWISHRFICFTDFILIALITVIVVGILSFIAIFWFFSEQPWQSFYNDGLGVFAALALYYLFWQLQLRLFATPDSFVSFEPWNTGWRNASALLFILGYISWLDISNFDLLTMPTSPVYFLTHLAGMSLFAANSMRQSDIVVTVITWHASLLLLILAVVTPLLVIISAQSTYSEFDVFPVSPLLWLLLATPAFLLSFSKSYSSLENVGYQLLQMLYYLMLFGGFMIFRYCYDALPKADFGFTALAIAIITMVIISSLSKFLKTFD